MRQNSITYTRFSLYFTYFINACLFSLPPLLFGTFHRLYGISYTLLGALALVNFVTQFSVDLLFTFFSKSFPIQKLMRIAPLFAAAGLLVYGASPAMMPENAYFGIVLGTVLFSVAAGLAETMVSPLLAALPSDNPGRDMSRLHSLYAYGFATVVVTSTVLLSLVGHENWFLLTGIWAGLFLMAFVLLLKAQIPSVSTSEEKKDTRASRRRRTGILLFMACIFLGSAAENTMANWISVYIETTLEIPKAVGDAVGMTAFALLLGITRTVYAKYGKSISPILLWGMVGAAGCYFVLAFSGQSLVSLAGCSLVGLFTSMLWPGTLILLEEKIPHAGIGVYALMAAAGDFGAAAAPQLLGAVADTVTKSRAAWNVGNAISLSAEQIGLRAGMLTAALFPMLGIAVAVCICHFYKKTEREN